MRDTLMILANALIFIGYLFAAWALAPLFRFITRWGIFWAAGFFVFCGLTHLELMLHTRGGVSAEEMTSLHMLGIHIPQSVFIWGMLIYMARRIRTLGKETDVAA